MKYVELPPVRKALGIAVVVVIVYVILEGTGIGGSASGFVGGVTSQVKNFFSRLLQKGPSGA